MQTNSSYKSTKWHCVWISWIFWYVHLKAHLWMMLKRRRSFQDECYLQIRIVCPRRKDCNRSIHPVNAIKYKSKVCQGSNKTIKVCCENVNRELFPHFPQEAKIIDLICRRDWPILQQICNFKKWQKSIVNVRAGPLRRPHCKILHRERRAGGGSFCADRWW